MLIIFCHPTSTFNTDVHGTITPPEPVPPAAVIDVVIDVVHHPHHPPLRVGSGPDKEMEVFT